MLQLELEEVLGVFLDISRVAAPAITPPVHPVVPGVNEIIGENYNCGHGGQKNPERDK